MFIQWLADDDSTNKGCFNGRRLLPQTCQLLEEWIMECVTLTFTRSMK